MPVQATILSRFTRQKGSRNLCLQDRSFLLCLSVHSTSLPEWLIGIINSPYLKPKLLSWKYRTIFCSIYANGHTSRNPSSIQSPVWVLISYFKYGLSSLKHYPVWRLPDGPSYSSWHPSFDSINIYWVLLTVSKAKG